MTNPTSSHGMELSRTQLSLGAHILTRTSLLQSQSALHRSFTLALSHTSIASDGNPNESRKAEVKSAPIEIVSMDDYDHSHLRATPRSAQAEAIVRG